MKIARMHSFKLSPRHAIELQSRLARRVSLRPFSKRIESVAGTDVSYDSITGRFFAGVVLLSWPGLKVMEIARARGRMSFPYVPGLLSFRELPPLLKAFRRLRGVPDLILCDGHGFAHPRFFGLACHLGIFLGIPTIGCAKSILVGQHGRVPLHRGGRASLVYRDHRVGTALRTREGVREIFVSPGHRTSFRQASDWSLRCTRRFRLPEPTRLADREVSRMRRAELALHSRPGLPEGLC